MVIADNQSPFQLRPNHETTQPFRTGVSMAVGEHTTICLAPRVRAT